MTVFKVLGVKVSDPRNGRLHRNIGNVPDAREHLRGKAGGAQLVVVKDPHVDGGTFGTIPVRITDLPDAMFGHTLVVGQSDQMHLRGADRRAGQAILDSLLQSQPQVAERFVENATIFQPKKVLDWAQVPFGLDPTPVVYVQNIARGANWEITSIEEGLFPFGSTAMGLCMQVGHYGGGLFEGIELFRTQDERAAFVRLADNGHRMNHGGVRLAMTPVPPSHFVEVVTGTTRRNLDFLPPFGTKAGLYGRPFHWGSGDQLGVSPAPSETFGFFLSVVGPYFGAKGFSGIKLRVETELHRAHKGGTGNVKAAGNYIQGIIHALEAKKDGFAELLWLDESNQNVEEAGAANAFFVFYDRKGKPIVKTPGLERGTILPGINRWIVLRVLKDLRIPKTDRGDLTLQEALTAKEAFCTGTAAALAPISMIEHQGRPHQFFNAGIVPENCLTRKLYDILWAIREGRFEDLRKAGLSDKLVREIASNWLFYVDEQPELSAA